MNRHQADQALRGLLDAITPPWSYREGLMQVLSASAFVVDDSLLNKVNRAFEHDGLNRPVVEAIATDLAERPVPERRDDLPVWRAWLKSVEDVGLAQRGLERLGSPRQHTTDLSDIFRRALVTWRRALESYPFRALLAGDGERATRETGDPVEPWTWLQGGQLREGLHAHKKLLPLAMAHWIASMLHSKDAGYLRQAVHEDERFRSTYRRQLRSLTATLYVTRWNPEWSLDVAASSEELDQAEKLLDVFLPHSGGRIEVRHHIDGTWWSFGDDVQSGTLLSWGEKSRIWPDYRDDLLGTMTTRLRVAQPAPEADLWHGLVSLRRVAQGEGRNRGLAVAEALARDLESGALAEALGKATEAFDSGMDVTSDVERLIAHALSLRLLLSDAALALSQAASPQESDARVSRLAKIMKRADSSHSKHGTALHLLDDSTYERIVDDFELDDHEWWGARARLDQRVPPGIVESLLREEIRRLGRGRRPATVLLFERPSPTLGNAPERVRLAAASESLAKDIGALPESRPPFARLGEVIRRLGDLPCPWLHRDVISAIAEATGDTPHGKTLSMIATQAPGRVPLLLYSQNENRGVLAELAISWENEHRPEDVWKDAGPLTDFARNAVRGAFEQLGQLTPLGVSPWEFSQHRMKLRLPEGFSPEARDLEIDGASIGLSALLALASLWTCTSVPAHVFATAALVGPQIAPVCGVRAKKQSILEVVSQAECTLLCHSQNLEEAGAIGVVVGTIAHALAAGGLDLKLTVPLGLGSVNDRLRALRNLQEDAQGQEVARSDARATWLDLADRMTRLIRSLENEPSVPKAKLDEWRCHAALAYTHTGSNEAAERIISTVSVSEGSPLRVRALHAIAQINIRIDSEELNRPSGRAAEAVLRAVIAELRRERDFEFLGRALGTLGRVRLHEYRVGEAIPLLEETVAIHGAPERLYERARSGVYLAMALRMIGRPEDALAELLSAADDLEAHTRRFSSEYAGATETYLWYEQARTLVSLGRPEEALDATAKALRRCEYQWWPQLGILRTRAWALRALLREGEADACVDRMLAVRENLAPAGASTSFIEQMIDEARRDAFEGGIVY
jgi:hypothetical protein